MTNEPGLCNRIIKLEQELKNIKKKLKTLIETDSKKKNKKLVS